MADNTTLNAGTGGDVIATDDIGGVKYQRVKVTHGGDGVATDTSSSDPLPVTLANTGANATAVKVDGSAVTQPVSGTVTANLAAGTNNIGDVDVLSVPAPLSTTGNGTAATALRVTLASDTTGTLGQLPTALDANGGMKVSGCTAHDSPDGTSAPIKVGAKAIAHGTNPTAVAADDRTHLYANRAGVLFVIGGHPNSITRTAYISDASGAQTDASIVGTIAAGTKVVVTAITVTADKGNTAEVAVKVGFGATTLPADSASGANGILLDHKGIAPGSGVSIGNGSGILGVGADGEELRLTCEDPVGGGVSVSFTYFTIES